MNPKNPLLLSVWVKYVPYATTTTTMAAAPAVIIKRMCAKHHKAGTSLWVVLWCLNILHKHERNKIENFDCMIAAGDTYSISFPLSP